MAKQQSSEIAGGGNRGMLRPHRPNGKPVALGPHRGSWQTLNVPNPQPGWVYAWALRNEGVLGTKVNKGWKVVRTSDSEFKNSSYTKEEGKALDSMRTVVDVVLLKIHEREYAAIQAEKAEYAKRVMDDAGASYMGNNSVYGNAPIRHQSPKHHIKVGDPLSFE